MERIALARAATMTVDEAANLLNIGRALAYGEIARTDQLAGVQVIRVGRKIKLPRRLFLAKLGIDQGPEAA
jgi:hypothetical protein